MERTPGQHVAREYFKDILTGEVQANVRCRREEATEAHLVSTWAARVDRALTKYRRKIGKFVDTKVLPRLAPGETIDECLERAIGDEPCTYFMSYWDPVLEKMGVQATGSGSRAYKVDERFYELVSGALRSDLEDLPPGPRKDGMFRLANLN